MRITPIRFASIYKIVGERWSNGKPLTREEEQYVGTECVLEDARQNKLDKTKFQFVLPVQQEQKLYGLTIPHSHNLIINTMRLMQQHQAADAIAKQVAQNKPFSLDLHIPLDYLWQALETMLASHLPIPLALPPNAPETQRPTKPRRIPDFSNN